jgi:TRAP-type C4-dicarboxylate transport system permease small subunit
MKNFLEKLNALLLFCMFIATILTIVFRNVLEISASWSEDLSQLTFILLVFIGATTVMQDEGHIKINTAVECLSKKGQRIVRIFGRLLMIPFLLLFAYGAWDNAMMNWEIELGTVEWIKIGHMYLVLALTTVIMLYYIAINIVRDVKDTYQQSTALNSTV